MILILLKVIINHFSINKSNYKSNYKLDEQKRSNILNQFLYTNDNIDNIDNIDKKQ